MEPLGGGDFGGFVLEAPLGPLAGEVVDRVVRTVARVAFQYYAPRVETAAAALLDNLARRMGLMDSGGTSSFQFPSSALVGLGQCGTTICQTTAKLLAEIGANNANKKPTNRWFSQFSGLFGSPGSRVLFQPLVFLADLNVDIEDRSQDIVRMYPRAMVIDLKWLDIGGSGNIPARGQYMARLALMKPLHSSVSAPSAPDARLEAWELGRNFLVDTFGDAKNDTRLHIYIFGTGGGSGSGLGPELGEAQQYFDGQRVAARSTAPRKTHCGLAVAVLPAKDNPNRAHILNTGRFLTRMLAQQYRRGRGDAASPPSFNAIILVSNDVMRSGSEKTAGDVAELANRYVSQQVFNLLAAQALVRDLTNDRFDAENKTLREGGIDGADILRLDAYDLKNSLVGLVGVAYAEQANLKSIDFDSLLSRACARPAQNTDTNAIEGLSIQLRQNDTETDTRSAITFQKSPTVVVVVSVPTTFSLTAAQVLQLRGSIAVRFQNAKIKRYALVKGASEHVSLTVFFCEGPSLSFEVRYHVLFYAKAAFRPPVGTKYRDTIDVELEKWLRGEDRDLPGDVRECLPAEEDLAPILAGALAEGARNQLKHELETKAGELLGGASAPSFENCLVSRDDLLDAVRMMRAVLQYGVVPDPVLEDL